MNRPYMQLINDLLERYNFAIYEKGLNYEPIAAESLIQGLKGLQQTAFFASDSDAYKEISHLLSCIEDGYLFMPYDITLAA
ncbi:DUF4754 family protein [Escherichia coli]|uniref:DUF4754 family protein n=1 Tax=Escherichia coli TaxID=562 RepID=UPI00136CC195|nr:DUF4754 family protein [Escherichia coli]